MTPEQRAQLAADLAGMTGDELETLYLQTNQFDDPERFEMIASVADDVWREYQAELAEMEGE